MTRRWPALVVLVIGELVLVGHEYVSGIGGAMPFATTYRSTYEGAVVLGGMCALIGCWALARLAARRWIWRGLGVTVAIAIAALAVYVPYHRQHGPLFVADGFRGHLERATPFHEQLAVPAFMTLGLAVAILSIALLTTARAGLSAAEVRT